MALTAFPWYGGKSSKLKWLLPLLPQTKYFCEVFCGSAAVTLNKPPTSVDIINDISGDVVNFFRVLREQPQAFMEAVSLTPYAREEHKACKSLPLTSDPVEKARRFFVAARQSRMGIAEPGKAGWSFSKHASTSGVARAVSSWLGGIERLPEMIDRLREVQVDQLSYATCIERYQHPDMLLYCDPPYDLSVRSAGSMYTHEFTEQDHRELARLLFSSPSKVAVSGYSSSMYEDMYQGWARHEAEFSSNNTSSNSRVEVLWTNY